MRPKAIGNHPVSHSPVIYLESTRTGRLNQWTILLILLIKVRPREALKGHFCLVGRKQLHQVTESPLFLGKSNFRQLSDSQSTKRHNPQETTSPQAPLEGLHDRR